MEKPTKFVFEEAKSKEVEKGYIVDNYIDRKENIGYSIVRTHLDGKHPLMKNIKSNRTYYLLNGKAEFAFEDSIIEVNEGEMLTIPANTKYSFKGKCDTILVSSPAFNPEDDVVYREEKYNDYNE